jgi:hypothetical protein
MIFPVVRFHITSQIIESKNSALGRVVSVPLLFLVSLFPAFGEFEISVVYSLLFRSPPRIILIKGIQYWSDTNFPLLAVSQRISFLRKFCSPNGPRVLYPCRDKFRKQHGGTMSKRDPNLRHIV